MEKDLSLLLNLQEVDDHLGELERSRIYLPEMIHNLEKEISDLENSIEENINTLKESELEQKSLELGIESNKQELDKFQTQMKVIKTNKEYDALISEIDNKKRQISDEEERVLTLMSGIDELNESLTELNSSLKEAQANNADQLAALREQESTLQAKIDEKMESRKGIAKDINRQIIGIYERVRKGKGGLVVVPIRKKACGGCFKQIPPQRIQEIRRGDRIFPCESCGRIVIWTDESKE
ncbi:MAG: C4-type zinc ribbon domain-containing protein [candidate division Zixibacteria bacterium]